MQGCCFCKEFENPYESQFYQEIGNQKGYISRILLETENWYAIPTIGCMTVGYVLLVCKQHYLSAANISKELYIEMLNLKALIESVLFQKLGLRCLAFEHGTPNPSAKGANSVDHVHIHILPFQKPVWSYITSNIPNANIEVLDSYNDLYIRWQKDLPDSYLFFQDIDQKLYYIPNACNMPSQLFRKCLAPHLGVDCWDWKSQTYADNIFQTIKLFK